MRTTSKTTCVSPPFSPVQPDIGIDRLLSSVDAAFCETGRRWFLFGARAVSVWGIPRLTEDVDVTVEDVATTADLIAALRKHDVRPRIDLDEEFVRRSRVLPMIHEGTDTAIDVVLAGPGLEEEFFARAKKMRVAGIEVPVISPEDLLITKILAGRPKDIEDVRGVLRVRGETLDLDRVRRVLGELERALGQSDLVPAFQRVLSEKR